MKWYHSRSRFSALSCTRRDRRSIPMPPKKWFISSLCSTAGSQGDSHPRRTDGWNVIPAGWTRGHRVAEENKERIVDLLIRKIDERTKKTLCLQTRLFREGERRIVNGWWKEDRFHLHFALRSAKELNTFLGVRWMKRRRGSWRPPKRRGSGLRYSILSSLIDTRPRKNRSILSPMSRFGAISSTVGTVDEFGRISAWEKEDAVEIGKPNAAGGSCPRTTSTDAIRTSRSSFPIRWAGRAGALRLLPADVRFPSGAVQLRA